MTAEQFWQDWDDKKWAKPSPEIVKPVCVAFAEAYHRAESAAQLADLKNQLDIAEGHWEHYAREFTALRAQLAEKEREIERLNKLFCDLTPGGSEFAGDPDYCAKYLRDRANTQTDLLKKKVIALRQREAELEQALKLMRNYARGAISAELFRTKTETLLAEFTARQPLPSPPKEAKS